MSVQEIEIAITQLNTEEFRSLSNWIVDYKDQQWDKQIKEDAKAGRFDRIITQAKEDCKNGLTRPL